MADTEIDKVADNGVDVVADTEVDKRQRMNGNSCVDIEWRVQYDNAVVNDDKTLKQRQIYELHDN